MSEFRLIHASGCSREWIRQRIRSRIDAWYLVVRFLRRQNAQVGCLSIEAVPARDEHGINVLYKPYQTTHCQVASTQPARPGVDPGGCFSNCLVWRFGRYDGMIKADANFGKLSGVIVMRGLLRRLRAGNCRDSSSCLHVDSCDGWTAPIASIDP